MRTLVIQFFMEPKSFEEPNFVNIGLDRELLEYSKLSARLYAKKCKADYKLITEPKINYKHPTFERMDLFHNNEWWDKYDQILYLDTDVICWPKAPNIFEMYPNLDSFKPVDDRKAMLKSPEWHVEREKDSILKKFDGVTLRTKRFNAGVLMLTRIACEIMKPFLNYKEFTDDDNRQLVYAMLESGVKTEYMDPMFNRKNGIDCYFGHAFGQKKFIPNNKVIRTARNTFKIKN
jgi:hypothetical protein